MTDKTIMKIGNVGGDYFRFYYSRKGGYNLTHFLTFDKDDYWIYKSTRNQKEVSYEEFLDFRFSEYILFKKDLYNKDDINKWINFVYRFGGIMYMNKPFPPVEIMNKIKIKK